MLMFFLTVVSTISATSDPFQYSDTLHNTAKQIVIFNKNNKPHSKFFGRERAMVKKGIPLNKNSSKN